MLNPRANRQCGQIKNDGNKRPYNTLPHFYILRRTSTRMQDSNILVLMSHSQKGGMYTLSLNFKRVVVIIICLSVDAFKVITKDWK